MSPSLRFLLALAFAGAPAVTFAATAPVSFNRDIRPIMSDTCFHCHGFDARARKAGMRLDIRAEALKPTKNDFIPIVPGKPEMSEIILRIMDDADPMPPEDAHKKLTPAQKELFRRWVAEGAVYEPHWAYAPLAKPAVPAIRDPKSEVRNPIDAFVRARLAEKKIAPSPEAEKARLLRRVSLDLTGLPPTPAETDAFLADGSRRAYENLVERLLASPRHGERMAVWWLDVARFTDTVGFHGDQNQRIFPYRDYVIAAFNTNKRFDQFTLEQLAGDLLPSPTTEQLVATGYNRLNMMTREGGAQAKEYLAKYGAERVRSVAAAWFGSTFGCAECHDHKFDPIKARDFYELQSFFADVKQWGVYSDYAYTPNPDLKGFNNDFPFPPEIAVESPYLRARRDRFSAELADLRSAAPVGAVEAWVAEARAFLGRNPDGWSELSPKTETPATDGKVAKKTTAKARGRGDARTLTFTAQPGRIASLRLDVATPAESKNSDLLRLAARLRHADGKEEKLEFAFADSNAKEARYNSGAEILGIATGWKIPSLPLSTTVSGVWQLAVPRLLAAGDEIVLSINGELTPGFRVLASPFAAADPLAAAGTETITAVAASPAQRTARQRDLLAAAAIFSHAVDRATLERAQRLAAEIRETRDGRAWSLVTEAVAKPIDVRVLPRGNWLDESGPVVLPATPSFLPGRRESTDVRRLTRLDLANWIVSRENPITARTVTNRLWAMFFGTGLSASVDDLGSQGELPSHPELLDWLASEFRDGGWDLRQIVRLIVTSATYRQSATLRPELRDVDPSNRLLAAQNPRRLEAEFVRDNALAVAGLLNLRDVGGPSVKPYQPAGYYAALQFPDRVYVASDDDEQWRRGVYMHWQRTFLHPMLANFDAPARDECAAARTLSNTPQQALTLLNDPAFVEAARVFAARFVSAGATDKARLTEAFRLALARPPKPVERESLLRLLAAQREYFRANAADTEKILRTGLAPRPAGDAADIAAWTQVARVILNLQEFITRY